MGAKIKIVCSLALMLCLSWVAVDAGGNLAEMRAAAEKIESISGDFIQEKQMPILAHPLTARGYFAYRKPASLRWEYREPIRSVLLLHDGKAHRFVKTGQDWVEEKADNTQTIDFMLQEIAKWLNGRFEDNPMFQVALEGGKKIVMTPKDQAMSKFIRRIELIMADRAGVMKEVIIYESADSFTRFIFADPRINEPVSPDEFQKVQ